MPAENHAYTSAYRINQPVLFTIIVVVKAEANFVDLTDIFSEPNLADDYARLLDRNIFKTAEIYLFLVKIPFSIKL